MALERLQKHQLRAKCSECDFFVNEIEQGWQQAERDEGAEQSSKQTILHARERRAGKCLARLGPLCSQDFVLYDLMGASLASRYHSIPTLCILMPRIPMLRILMSRISMLQVLTLRVPIQLLTGLATGRASRAVERAGWVPCSARLPRASARCYPRDRVSWTH